MPFRSLVLAIACVSVFSVRAHAQELARDGAAAFEVRFELKKGGSALLTMELSDDARSVSLDVGGAVLTLSGKDGGARCDHDSGLTGESGLIQGGVQIDVVDNRPGTPESDRRKSIVIPAGSMVAVDCASADRRISQARFTPPPGVQLELVPRLPARTDSNQVQVQTVTSEEELDKIAPPVKDARVRSVPLKPAYFQDAFEPVDPLSPKLTRAAGKAKSFSEAIDRCAALEPAGRWRLPRNSEALQVIAGAGDSPARMSLGKEEIFLFWADGDTDEASAKIRSASSVALAMGRTGSDLDSFDVAKDPQSFKYVMMTRGAIRAAWLMQSIQGSGLEVICLANGT